jgi:Tfp pilus assembly protein PilO
VIVDKNRLWVVGAVITIVAIIGGGWILGIQPQLSAIANANQKRASVQAQNTLNETLLVKLKKDYQGIGELRQQLNSLRTAVPASAEIPAFVTELNTVAKKYGITVKSISINDAKPYSPSATAAGGTSSTTTNPKITPVNFVLIPVQLMVSGPYARVLDFVHQVQIGSRLFFVSMLSSSGSTDINGTANSKRSTIATPEQVDATVGGLVYVLLDNGQQ